MIGAIRGPQGREYQLLSTSVFATGGTQSYTIPNGARFLAIEMCGGGGGGGGGRIVSGRPSLYYGGGGGAGGGYATFTFWGGDGYGSDYNGIVTGCNNFDMQPGDTIEFRVGNPGLGGSVGNNGATGGATRLISHKRNGVVVLDHDDVTGWVSSDEFAPSDYYCQSSYFYSLSVPGGAPGISPIAIPAGAGINLARVDLDLPDRKNYYQDGSDGSNNSGTTVASPGGGGGKSTIGAQGASGAAGAAGGDGKTGGGGGGGGSNSTARGKGGDGGTGAVIIRAYG